MSWDLFVQDLPPGIRSIAEIPDDFRPRPLGARSQIIERIWHAAPETNFSDPAWGQLDGEGFSIEVNLGEDEEVVSFALHVRGDERAPFMVETILKAVGLRALDPSSNTGIFEVGKASESFARWRAYRDRVVGREGV